MISRTADEPSVDDIYLGLADAIPEHPKASGFVRVPISSNSSAYGFLPVPFAVAGKSAGPTVLLIGGAHGDEVDSQLAITHFLRRLDIGTMSGRVFALPMANEPACRAGLRNSPLDGGCLSRSYPGDLLGSATQVIAQYIEKLLMPQFDIVIEPHSAGASFAYLSCSTVISHADRVERVKRLAAGLAFGAQNLLIFDSFEERNSSGAAKRAGTVRVGCEVSGPSAVGEIVRGIDNILRWSGVTPGHNHEPVASRTGNEANIRMVRQSDYSFSQESGVFEPVVELGSLIEAGELVGSIHDLSKPLSRPTPVRAQAEGMVVCLRAPGVVQRGDCVLHTAGELDSQLQEEVEEARVSTWVADRYAGAKE